MNTVKTSGQPLQFTAEGYLPPGVHDRGLTEIKALVFTNQHRRFMWYRLMAFLCLPVLVPRFSFFYLAGGLLSTAPTPSDVDVILETRDPYGPNSFATMENFFIIGLDKIREVYSVDLQFWMEGAPSGLRDYRAFFQYEKPRRSREKINPARRGIVRFSPSPAELAQHLSPFDPRLD